MRMLIGLVMVVVAMAGCELKQALAHPINMEVLAEIESSNNPKAYNKKSGARGLYQITPIVLKQFNDKNTMDEVLRQGHRAVTEDGLFNPDISWIVANWYLDWLSERCDTVDEILIGWNWGIGHLRKWQNCSYENMYDNPNQCRAYISLPKETRDFLKKYHKLEELK